MYGFNSLKLKEREKREREKEKVKMRRERKEEGKLENEKCLFLRPHCRT